MRIDDVLKDHGVGGNLKTEVIPTDRMIQTLKGSGNYSVPTNVDEVLIINFTAVRGGIYRFKIYGYTYESSLYIFGNDNSISRRLNLRISVQGAGEVTTDVALIPGSYRIVLVKNISNVSGSCYFQYIRLYGELAYVPPKNNIVEPLVVE